MEKTALLSNLNGEKMIKLRFDYNKDLVEQVKRIPGRVFNKFHNCWFLPLTLNNCFITKHLNFTFKKQLKTWANEEYFRQRGLHKEIKYIPGLKLPLMPFQLDGVNMIEAFDGKCLLADEMGLGKTAQTLAWLQLRQDCLPAAVVCPASLKLNWEKEVKKWTNFKSYIIDGKFKDGDFLEAYPIYIINYDIVNSWLPVLQNLKIKTVVLDEIHYIKERKAQRTKACTQLCKQKKHILGLTGTPIENRPSELWVPIKLINNTLFKNQWTFNHRYCGAKHNGFGWQFNGATNTEELHNILKESMLIRRLKSNVLKDLPDKTYTTIPLEITTRKLYDRVENDFIQYIEDSVRENATQVMNRFLAESRGINMELNEGEIYRQIQEKIDKSNPLTIMEILKQITIKGKMETCISWIEDFLENGEKLVVFTWHQFVLDLLYERFKKIAVKLDGSTSKTNRELAVETFQTKDKTRLFLSNLQAGGVGITLTAASNVAILEYPWKPGLLAQAIDRVHRIGQKDAVNAWFLVGKNTIEEQIIDIILRKQKMAEAVIDGTLTESVSLYHELLKSIQKGYDNEKDS